MTARKEIIDGAVKEFPKFEKRASHIEEAISAF